MATSHTSARPTGSEDTIFPVKPTPEEAFFALTGPAPEFDGDRDYVVVQTFLKSFEKYCGHFRATSGERLRINISICLKDDALTWWYSIKRQHENLDIKEFVKLVKDYFISDNVLIEAGNRLVNLQVDYNDIEATYKEVQNAIDLFEEKNLSVEQVFTLLFYCGEVHPEIKERLDTDVHLKSFNTLVEAIVVKMELLKEMYGADYYPAPYPRHNNSGPGRVDKHAHARNSNHTNSRMRRTNSRCHSINNFGSRKCHYCHRVGHIQANCKSKNGERGRVQANA